MESPDRGATTVRPRDRIHPVPHGAGSVRRRLRTEEIAYTPVVVWEVIFLLVILKIPIVYLCLVVYWAIKAEPKPLEPALKTAPLGSDPLLGRPRAGSRRPRGGPHGAPSRTSPRTSRAAARAPAR